MHLIYLDESGNSGRNLADLQQPVFVLGALIVNEPQWKPLEEALEQTIHTHLGRTEENFEIHATDIRNGTGAFDGVSLSIRLAFRDALLDVAHAHKLAFIYRAITKKRYTRWLEQTYGKGVFFNPHLAAFPLVAQVLNNYLVASGPDDLGILIMDENREVATSVERSVRLLRADPGSLKLNRIIEKGFFVDSRKSIVLQLADLCCYQARKLEEAKLGLPAKSVDAEGVAKLSRIVQHGPESFNDVLRWISQHHKPE
jgi:hypothetical protein